jgi:hypothetical protein
MRARVLSGRVRTPAVLLALVFLLALATYVLVPSVPASVAATVNRLATPGPTTRPQTMSTLPPGSLPPNATPSPGRGQIPVGSASRRKRSPLRHYNRLIALVTAATWC